MSAPVVTPAASVATPSVLDLGVGGNLGLATRTGEAGAGLLTAEMVAVAVSQPLGPVRLRAAALVLDVGNGWERRQGTAGAIGLGTRPDGRLVVEGTLGTSPVGLSESAYATWGAGAQVAVDRSVRVGVDAGRAPVTDSLASWAGSEVDGDEFGRVATTWAGAWLDARTPSRFDAGARVRAGTLDGPWMEPLQRREVSAWAGQRFGDEARAVRVGATGAAMSHDRQVDGFAAGQAGAFTPLGYTAGFLRVDGRWGPADGARIEGGAAAGVQSLSGTDTTFVAVGTHGAWSARLVGAVPLGDGWEAELGVHLETVGANWRQTGGGVRVRWRVEDAADVATPAAFGSLPEVLGAP